MGLPKHPLLKLVAFRAAVVFGGLGEDQYGNAEDGMAMATVMLSRRSGPCPRHLGNL